MRLVHDLKEGVVTPAIKSQAHTSLEFVIQNFLHSLVPSICVPLKLGSLFVSSLYFKGKRERDVGTGKIISNVSEFWTWKKLGMSKMFMKLLTNSIES